MRLAPFGAVTVTENEKVPVLSTVPEIVPSAEIARPSGKPFALHVRFVIPVKLPNAALYATPSMAFVAANGNASSYNASTRSDATTFVNDSDHPANNQPKSAATSGAAAEVPDNSICTNSPPPVRVAYPPKSNVTTGNAALVVAVAPDTRSTPDTEFRFSSVSRKAAFQIRTSL